MTEVTRSNWMPRGVLAKSAHASTWSCLRGRFPFPSLTTFNYLIKLHLLCESVVFLCAYYKAENIKKLISVEFNLAV